MKKILTSAGIVLVAAGVIFALIGCGTQEIPAPVTSVTTQVEEPVCDFEDIVERDTDCGFTKSSPKPDVRPKVRTPGPPPPAPAPRSTPKKR